MRDLKRVLYEKEIELARVRQQVEALRFVAPLLTEQNDAIEEPRDPFACEPGQRNRWSLRVS